MRSTKEIDAESAKIYALMEKKDRFNNETMEQFRAQVEVLDGRMTEKQIESRWYRDESDEDYTDGDNDLYHELIRTMHWMRGDKGYEAPSEGAE